MPNPIVFMYSGQGSQYYQMGQSLYEQNPRFRSWMDYCDELASPLLSESLTDVLYGKNEKNEPFDQVRLTNPALLCLQYSLTRVLLELNIVPDYLLGYSLGEITASVVSGAITLEQGLEFTIDFASMLDLKTKPAGMLAVIVAAEKIDQHRNLFKDCWVIGQNCPNNMVLSGHVDDIDRLQHSLQERQIICQRLPVNIGFHTELINPIESQFKRSVTALSWSDNDIPIISASSAEGDFKPSAEHFWYVARNPIQFDRTVLGMINTQNLTFVDVGPSGSLATFVKYLVPKRSASKHYETMNMFGKDVDALAKLKLNLAS